MKKDYRLRFNKDFQYTYKRGKSLGHSLLVMIYRKNNIKNTRIGFSISKKFGNAVKRNKIKRQLREILTKELDNLKNGYDIIFVVRKNAQNAAFSKLEKAVYNLIRRANLYKERELQ